jgi:hypothetical protein
MRYNDVKYLLKENMNLLLTIYILTCIIVILNKLLEKLFLLSMNIDEIKYRNTMDIWVIRQDIHDIDDQMVH